MKPKTNRAGADTKKPSGYDSCQTPWYALPPLIPYLPLHWTIWEPAAGKGYLVEALQDNWYETIASDMLTGQDFFEWQPDAHWDAIVTNPPYSLKPEWIERCYELGHPWALLMPVETLGAWEDQEQFEARGIEIVLLDKRIDFGMPNIGFEDSHSQFPVAWFTWGLNIGKTLTYGRVPKPTKKQLDALKTTQILLA